MRIIFVSTSGYVNLNVLTCIMDDFTTTFLVPNVRALILPQLVTVNELARQMHKHDNTTNTANFILILLQFSFLRNRCAKTLICPETIVFDSKFAFYIKEERSSLYLITWCNAKKYDQLITFYLFGNYRIWHRF